MRPHYPLFASDYLDMSGFSGNGSVAGVVSSDSKIVIGYRAGMTFKQAERVAAYLNQKRPDFTPELTEALRKFERKRKP